MFHLNGEIERDLRQLRWTGELDKERIQLWEGFLVFPEVDQ